MNHTHSRFDAAVRQFDNTEPMTDDDRDNKLEYYRAMQETRSLLNALTEEQRNEVL